VTEVVNLNRARKARARDEASAAAAANRVAHGLTKAQKAVARAAKGKARALLDGHKREP
jgi:hypothetical protein